MCIPQILDVFATGLVAGAFGMGTFALHPAVEQLEPATHLRLRQELIRRLASFMPPFLLLPIPASIAAMALCRTAVTRGVDAAALFSSLTTVGITVAVNAPLNRRFATWSTEALAPEWHDDVQRWNAAHTARMWAACAAFVCTILAWR